MANARRIFSLLLVICGLAACGSHNGQVNLGIFGTFESRLTIGPGLTADRTMVDQFPDVSCYGLDCRDNMGRKVTITRNDASSAGFASPAFVCKFVQGGAPEESYCVDEGGSRIIIDMGSNPNNPFDSRTYRPFKRL